MWQTRIFQPCTLADSNGKSHAVNTIEMQSNSADAHVSCSRIPEVNLDTLWDDVNQDLTTLISTTQAHFHTSSCEKYVPKRERIVKTGFTRDPLFNVGSTTPGSAVEHDC